MKESEIKAAIDWMAGESISSIEKSLSVYSDSERKEMADYLKCSEDTLVETLSKCQLSMDPLLIQIINYGMDKNIQGETTDLPTD